MHFQYTNDIKHSETESTRFLALDKPLPKRPYIDFIDIEVECEKEMLEDPAIYFDGEWLSILKAFNDYIPLENTYYNFSGFMSQVTYPYYLS